MKLTWEVAREALPHLLRKIRRGRAGLQAGLRNEEQRLLLLVLQKVLADPERGLEELGGSAQDWNRLGLTAEELHWPNEAEVCYRIALVQDPTLTQAWLALAHLAEEAEDSGKAAQAVLKAYGREPTNHQIARHLVRLGGELEQVGGSDEVCKFYEKALAYNPAEVLLLTALAEVHTTKGETAEAERCYVRAIRTEPTNADLWTKLALIQIKNHRPMDAEQSIRSVLELQPNDVHTLVLLGDTLATQGRNEEAEGTYKKALRLDQSSAVGWNNIGIILEEGGDLKRAEAAFKHASSLQPNATSLTNLADLLADLGRVEEAEMYYRQALGMTQDATTWNNLGWLLERLGRGKEAQQCYEKSLELEPSAETWCNLALMHWTAQQWEKVQQYLLSAVQANDSYSFGWYCLGVLHLQQDPITAREYLWEALDSAHPNWHRRAEVEEILEGLPLTS